MKELSLILQKRKDNGWNLTKPLPILKQIKLQSRLKVQSLDLLLSYIQKRVRLWESENLCLTLIHRVQNQLALLLLQQNKLQRSKHQKLKISQKLPKRLNKPLKQQKSQKKLLKLVLLRLLQSHQDKESKLVKLCQDFAKGFHNASKKLKAHMPF